MKHGAKSPDPVRHSPPKYRRSLKERIAEAMLRAFPPPEKTS